MAAGKIDPQEINGTEEITINIGKLFREVKMKKTTLTVMMIAMISAGALANYVDMVNALDPVSYWRVEELAGDAAADERGTQDGEYNNGVLLGQPGALPPYCSDSVAVYFDGGNDYLAVPHNAAYELRNGTIQFWFKDTGSITNGALFSKDSMGYDLGGHLTIATQADTQKLRVRLQSDDDSYVVLSTDTVELGQWYLMTFTFGVEGMKLYMNDELIETNAYNGGLVGNLEPLALGASTMYSDDGELFPMNDHWSGYMDEIVIYDTVLTPQQISDLYNCVPEPATMVMLAIGGLLLRRRR